MQTTIKKAHESSRSSLVFSSFEESNRIGSSIECPDEIVDFKPTKDNFVSDCFKKIANAESVRKTCAHLLAKITS